MKILWFNHRDLFHPEAGGAELRLHEVAKRLCRDGFGVKLYCERWANSKKEELVDGIEINRIADKFTIHLKVPFILNSTNYDVVIDDISHAIPWFSPLFTTKPVICQIHHLHQDVVFREFPYPYAKIIQTIERSIPHVYQNFITVSESSKKALINKFGIDENRIKIIYNGVTVERLKTTEKNPYPTLVWIGRMKRYKRIEHVLMSYKIVEKRIPASRLFVIGDGDYYSAIKNLAGKLNLHNVVFTGKINETEKNTLISQAWALVNTSAVEGWGNTVIEGAAYGTPTIAYYVEGLKDSIQNGKTGILVENGNIVALANAIIDLLEDDTLRYNLSKKSLENSKKYDWETTVSEFENVLKRETND
jgi:glycosyltransferase involved in cell wall biosynthesis